MRHTVGIGVLGARSWIFDRALRPAIEAAPGCALVAVASRGGSVPASLAHLDAGTYEAVLDHPGVQAVYVPLANGLHRAWVERAAASGKHVLCEKPLAPSADEARAMASACETAGVVLAEAWMTPFHPRWRAVVDLAGSGRLGEVRHVRGEFTFTIGPERTADYRWNRSQGGGALLDVGIYALGVAAHLWGDEPLHVAADATRTASGVDATCSVWCDWGAGRTASALVSFELPERQRLEIVGTAGRVVIEDRAFTGGSGATTAQLQRPDGTVAEVVAADADPYQRMVEAFVAAVQGEAPWPRPATESVAFLRLLDRVAEVAE